MEHCYLATFCLAWRSRTSLKVVLNFNDKRIRFFKVHNHGIIAISRNKGIRLACGEWISFLDSDDEWKKDKLQNQVDYLKKHPYFKLIQSDEIWIRNGDHFNKN